MNVSSTSFSSGGISNGATNPFKQQMQDFRGLSSALQSGDISQAQSAFATLQKDLQASSQNGKPSPLLDPNTQAGKDFKALQSALQSGDAAAAQQAFASVKQDLRGAHTHGHHHHKPDNDGDGGAAAQSPAAVQPSGSTSQLLNATA